ncbi:hypothetical protein [Neptunomonas sp.]|uniref:hypothetical protein n=1 Tax=Neptunomonas sp. TaxID=1971898 RepID=UPI00356785C5
MNREAKEAERTVSKGAASLTDKERGLRIDGGEISEEDTRLESQVTDEERGIIDQTRIHQRPRRRFRVCPSMESHPDSIQFETTFIENFVGDDGFQAQVIGYIGRCVERARAPSLVIRSNLRELHAWLSSQGMRSMGRLPLVIHLNWSPGRVEEIRFESRDQSSFSRDEAVRVEGLASPRFRQAQIDRWQAALVRYGQQRPSLRGIALHACDQEIDFTRFTIWLLQNWDTISLSREARSLFWRRKDSLRSESYSAYYAELHSRFRRSWLTMQQVCQVGVVGGSFQPGRPGSVCQQRFQRWWTLNEQVLLYDQRYRIYLTANRSLFGTRIR